MRPLRIAFCGFHIECCTFSPLPSTAADFEVQRGDNLLKGYPFLSGYDGDVEAVPLVRARALPGGPVARRFYDGLKAECREGLERHGPWDGIFLDIHGAAKVDGVDDAEADFIEALRSVAGPACLIAAGYDLHGNLTPRLMQALDILTAYRTAPHRDWQETEARAFRLLVDCLRRGIRPCKACIDLPLLLTGEQSATDWDPGAGLYEGIPTVIGGSVFDASINVGYAWADEPRVAASVVALGTEQSAVNAAARTLAQQFWALRRDFRFGAPTGDLDTCIRRACRAGRAPVLISDSGDNITAGAPGDLTLALEALCRGDVYDAIVAGIPDAGALAQCQAAGAGSPVTLSLGGKLDPVHGRPLTLNGRVESLWNPLWAFDTSTASVRNPTAVVRAGGIRVVVSQRRTPYFNLSDFRQLGLVPEKARIIVVKMGYLSPELDGLAALSLLALSPGAVNQRLDRLPYRRIRRPIFPFDPEIGWQPVATGARDG